MCHKTWGCNWSFGIDTYVHTMYVLKWWILNRNTYLSRNIERREQEKKIKYNKAEKKKREFSVTEYKISGSPEHKSLSCVYMCVYVYLLSGSNS